MITTILSILGVIFLIIIYIKLGINLSEYFWVKPYSLEEFFNNYLNQPFYGILNFLFNFILWPIGIILNLLTMKFWRPKNYIKPHYYKDRGC